MINHIVVLTFRHLAVALGRLGEAVLGNLLLVPPGGGGVGGWRYEEGY